MRLVSTSLEDLFRTLKFYFCDFFNHNMNKEKCYHILLLLYEDTYEFAWI